LDPSLSPTRILSLLFSLLLYLLFYSTFPSPLPLLLTLLLPPLRISLYILLITTSVLLSFHLYTTITITGRNVRDKGYGWTGMKIRREEEVRGDGAKEGWSLSDSSKSLATITNPN